ncbi:hypothetical protein F4692_003885 [Nocardioides cavernae]|uniref:Transglutaminase-like domain-containing protein n=1 Tax=Nocardioides cavernae TaxID=1921566 RepID=A0A7Y9H6C2_9ACTN|nr:transglutaminase domain-containing protein [Nocardioides cavernae]NYE38734.1 hypothetical protein [Nocardioides cavernae]
MTRRGTALDVSAVLLLVAIALSVLDDTFADRSYLVVGLVPGVGLVVLALMTRHLDEGVWWYALGAVVAFAPLAAIFALGRPGPYVVPTLDTMAEVMGDLTRAPSVLVSTAPPVDTAGQVMLVPFVLGYFGVGFAAWLALGTRSPVAPAVPLVLTMAGAIPLGVLVPAYLVPRGILFALLLVVWVSARGTRRESAPGTAARGAAGRTAAAVVIVGLVSSATSVAMPDRDESDRVLLRGDGNSDLVAGAAGSVLPEQGAARRPLFRVTGVPEGRRLRLAVLDSYDGFLWAPADVTPGSDGYGTFKRIGQEVTAPYVGTSVEVRVEMLGGYTGDWLPLLGALTSLDLEEFDGRTQLDDVRYNLATSSALVVGGVDPRDDYTFTAELLPDDLARGDEAAVAAADQRQPAGEFLDDHLAPFERADVAPLGRVLLLARYLRTRGATRFSGESLQGPDDLGTNMLGSRTMTGTPFQYAALMALGASRLGVPGRVVTGAVPGPRGVVRAQDVGVWVELQLADGTWRTLEPRRYVGAELVREEQDDPGGDDPGRFVADLLDRADDGGGLGTPDSDERPPRRGQDEPTEEDETDPAAAADVLRAVLVLGVVVLALLLLVAPAKLVRRRWRRRASSWTAIYVNGWQEVLDTARDRGTPVPESWSRVAQAGLLGAGTELARRADAAVFAPGRPDDDADDYWQACQELRAELLAAASRRRRWWSRVNPASLVAGWARRRSPASVREVRHEDGGARRQYATRA